jgi:hypothetical protein
MSSPVLNSTDFALVAKNLPSSVADRRDFEGVESDGSALLTARAIMAVTLLGAGFWYMLWKCALHFWMMH